MSSPVLRASAVFLCSALLVACGGGSSSDTADPTTGLNRISCATFAYQGDAQLYLAANPSAAAALDADGNGVACEALPVKGSTTPGTPTTPTTPTTPVVAAAVVPQGSWVGTLDNGDGLRGVVFPSGESWFVRTRTLPYGTQFPTWIAQGTKGTATEGGKFAVVDAQAFSVSGNTAIRSGTATWAVTTTPATSMTGSWGQGNEVFALSAAYQASDMVVPLLTTLVGTYTDPQLAAASPSATSGTLPLATISATDGYFGRLSGHLDTSCIFTGEISTDGKGAAYQVYMHFNGTCPNGLTGGPGVMMYDQGQRAIYILAINEGSISTPGFVLFGIRN